VTRPSFVLRPGALFRAEALFAAALAIGALSLEAGGGNAAAFDPRIHALRGQAGQRTVAERLRGLLAGSGIQDAGGAGRVQDPYCLRCLPQVMGRVLDQLSQAARVLAGEIAGVSDNPLIDFERDEVLYGGNFHAQPIALTAEGLAYCLAEIGSMSERRTAFLVDSRMSGLPPFLVEEGGLNSGFMVAQITAAALASENKGLAHPGSLDSIPTAANQEDYVSMATFAARRLGEMADNLRDILAIELLAAAQGLHLRRPAQTSGPLEATVARLRERVGPWQDDRFFAPDLGLAAALIDQPDPPDLFSPEGVGQLPILAPL
jgi:histidine ammonia-lyase